MVWYVAAVDCWWLRLLCLDKVASGFPPPWWLSLRAIVECQFHNGDSIKSPLSMILNPLFWRPEWYVSLLWERYYFIVLILVPDNYLHCKRRENPVLLFSVCICDKSVMVLALLQAENVCRHYNSCAMNLVQPQTYITQQHCFFNVYVLFGGGAFEVLTPQTDLLHRQRCCEQVVCSVIQTSRGLIYRSKWSESLRGRTAVSSPTAELWTVRTVTVERLTLSCSDIQMYICDFECTFKLHVM